MVEDTIQVFMDDFSVVEDSIYKSLSHLSKVVKRCNNCNLVVNSKKFHFMINKV